MPLGLGGSIGHAYVEVSVRGDGADEDVRKILNDAVDGADMEAAGERGGKAYSKGFDKETEKKMEARAKRLEQLVEKTDKGFNTLSKSIGKSFGKGSRNDFLNFIGSAVEGLTKLAFLGPRLAVRLGKHLATAFTDAGGGLRGGLIVGTQLLGGALLGLAAAGPIAAAGLAALSLVIGPLAALMSGLLGVVLALASTLAFGLVGALAAVGAALVPLAIGVGVAVAAFASMSDAQKKVLKADLKPLTREFRSLGNTAFKAITKDIGQNAKDLAPVFRRFRPLVAGVGTAISNIGTAWTTSMTGAGFRRFQRVLENNIPGMLESLGTSLGNAAGGLGGLFTGAIPTAKRFLSWLEKITAQFSTWANSPTGQKEIKKFLDRAGDSAETLGGFLSDVWDTLTLILDSGKDTGDDLFSQMGDAVKNFGDYLKENPDAMNDFFDNAKETGESLGTIAVNLGKIFDELDSPQNRKNMQTFLSFAEGISSGDIESDNPWYQNMGAGLNRLWKWGGWHGLSALIHNVTDPFADAASGKFNLFPGNQKFNFAKVGRSFKEDFIDEIVNFDYSGTWDSIVSSIKGWGTKVGESFMEDFIGTITGWFTGGGGGGLSALQIKLPSPDISGWGAGIREFFAGIKLPQLNMPNITWPKPPAWLSKVGIGWAVGKIPWPKIPGWLSKIDISWALKRIPWPKVPSWLSVVSIGWKLAKVPWPAIPGWLSTVSIGWALDHIPWPDVPDWLSSIHIGFDVGSINWPSPPSWLSRIPFTASGGVFSGAQHRIIGEAGPEAVVPLRRPLSQVDPSVRWLSAIAQGQSGSGAVAPPQPTTAKNVFESGAITVISPASDARAVAWETLNYITAAGY